MWLVQGTRTVCSAFLCNENKKLGLLTPAPVFFDFIFLLPGLSSLHLCLGILGHKSTNDRRKWTKSHLVIGNPVNNLNIVTDTSQVDELHPDKQHLSQMFLLKKSLMCSLSKISPVLPLEAKRAKGESSFTLFLNKHPLTHSGPPFV